MNDIETAFARVRDIALARGLPGIEEGTSYGTPALRVRRKPLVRMKDAETLVFMCAIEGEGAADGGRARNLLRDRPL